MEISSLVRASIGWTLLLTVSVVAAVFTVNNQFQTVNAQFRHIEDNFDQKIEAMSDRVDNKIQVLSDRVDDKIETLSASVDRRFEAVDERLDRIEVNVATILTTLQSMQKSQNTL